MDRVPFGGIFTYSSKLGTSNVPLLLIDFLELTARQSVFSFGPQHAAGGFLYEAFGYYITCNPSPMKKWSLGWTLCGLPRNAFEVDCMVVMGMFSAVYLWTFVLAKEVISFLLSFS